MHTAIRIVQHRERKMDKYTGHAEILKNAFLGSHPHELTIVLTNGNLGDFRRFAVNTVEEAKEKCKQFNVKPNF